MPTLEIKVPANPEAEHGVLGTLLLFNKLYGRVSGKLKAADFHDPLHGRIFQAISDTIERGGNADPITLRHLFDKDPDIAKVGGVGYLGELAASVVAPGSLADYAAAVAEASLRRQMIEAGVSTIEAAGNAALPPAETLGAVQDELFALAESSNVAARETKQAGTCVGSALDLIDAAFRNGASLVGVTTGLRDLDEKLGGLQRGNLILLGARPAMGKSGLAFNTVMLAATRAGKRVLGFSLEMTAEEISMRHIAAETGIPVDRMRAGRITLTEMREIEACRRPLSDLPFAIDETGGITVSHIRQRARQMKRRKGLDLIIVDHINIMSGSKDAKRGGLTAEVTEISGGLKALAKELDVPVLVLSQLSRGVEQRDDKRPQLSDLRQSGSIEQDADVVMFLFRKEYYLQGDGPTKNQGESEEKFNQRYADWQRELNEAANVGEIDIAKNRNGPTGTVKVHFDGPRTLFSNLAR